MLASRASLTLTRASFEVVHEQSLSDGHRISGETYLCAAPPQKNFPTLKFCVPFFLNIKKSGTFTTS